MCLDLSCFHWYNLIPPHSAGKIFCMEIFFKVQFALLYFTFSPIFGNISKKIFRFVNNMLGLVKKADITRCLHK